MALFANVEVFQPIRAQLGEGPCWHPQRQTLWWIDILGRKYFEADLAGTPPRVLDSLQMIGAIAPTESGGLIAALHDGIYLVEPDTGATTLFARVPGHDSKLFRFNDAKVDPRGRFWAGTLALDGRSAQSHLYRVTPDRAVVVMQDRVSVSNGLAWAPDGKTLYYIDSPTRTVRAFAFDLEQGTLGPSQVVITLGKSDGWPDGCCMDSEGCLWLAHWGGSKVTRWDPRRGRLLATVALPVANVTSCAFGGSQRDQLFITTAVDSEKTTPEPEAGFVFRINPQTTGPELATFGGA
jgi:sugar lactone lactonase YvrE